MVSMCKEKKAYIQPSVELYAVTHILLDGSHSVNEVGDKITKEFDIDTRMWYDK